MIFPKMLLPAENQQHLWTLLLLLLWLVTSRFGASASAVAGSGLAPQQRNAQQMSNAPQQQTAEQHQSPHQQQQHQQQSLSVHSAHAHQLTTQQQQSHQLPISAQYTHDQKETGFPANDPIKDISTNNNDEEYADPYQFLNELKPEPRLPWNPYALPEAPLPGITVPHIPYPYEAPVSPRFLPMFSYPQPVFVPFPMYIAPELFYPTFTGANNNIDGDESLSRAAGDRRTGAGSPGFAPRNSPIYYVRLPPVPYMFLPNMGYTPASPHQSTGSAFGAFAAMPTFPTLSPVFNLPMSFVANGKPSSIYQMGEPPNDIQNQAPFGGNINGFGTRPPPPPALSSTHHHGGYRPVQVPTAGNNYLTHAPFGVASPQPVQSLHHDSKLTLLKRPYIFNGRPEDIYILPNSFSPIYNNRDYFGSRYLE